MSDVEEAGQRHHTDHPHVRREDRANQPGSMRSREGVAAPGADWRLLWATARVFVLRYAATPIMLVRAPLTPLLFLVTFTLVYQISGQSSVPRADVEGFLVVGMLGLLAWNSTIWGSGNALQAEIHSGTIAAVVVAPTRTTPVVLGHGVGSMVWDVPGLASCVAVGVLLGARFEIHDPLAVLVSLLAVYAGALCIGVGFAGLFIMSRQSNALSNFLQAPIWLLAGFFVPRTALPGWLHPVSDVIPLAHAVDALRATTLDGQSLSAVGGSLVATAGTSVAFLVAGIWSLRRVDMVVRRRGTLDLL